MSEDASNTSGMADLMLTFHANPAPLQAAGLRMGSTTPITLPITTQKSTQESTQSKLRSLMPDKPDISEQEMAEASS